MLQPTETIPFDKIETLMPVIETDYERLPAEQQNRQELGKNVRVRTRDDEIVEAVTIRNRTLLPALEDNFNNRNIPRIKRAIEGSIQDKETSQIFEEFLTHVTGEFEMLKSDPDAMKIFRELMFAHERSHRDQSYRFPAKFAFEEMDINWNSTFEKQAPLRIEVLSMLSGFEMQAYNSMLTNLTENDSELGKRAVVDLMILNKAIYAFTIEADEYFEHAKSGQMSGLESNIIGCWAVIAMQPGLCESIAKGLITKEQLQNLLLQEMVIGMRDPDTFIKARSDKEYTMTIDRSIDYSASRALEEKKKLFN